MYKLSGKAVEDFRGIYDYTLGKFGEEQADRYTDSLGIFWIHSLKCLRLVKTMMRFQR